MEGRCVSVVTRQSQYTTHTQEKSHQSPRRCTGCIVTSRGPSLHGCVCVCATTKLLVGGPGKLCHPIPDTAQRVRAPLLTGLLACSVAAQLGSSSNNGNGRENDGERRWWRCCCSIGRGGGTSLAGDYGPPRSFLFSSLNPAAGCHLLK